MISDSMHSHCAKRPGLPPAVALIISVMALAACSNAEHEKTPVPLTRPEDRSGAPVVRRELPDVTTPQSTGTGATPAPLAVKVPPDAIYVCVSQADGQQKQVVIEFDAKVGALCKKAPEMGPCQYERETCRRSGGRVFASDGSEITAATEAEYDKKVMRVRFKAN